MKIGVIVITKIDMIVCKGYVGNWDYYEYKLKLKQSIRVNSYRCEDSGGNEDEVQYDYKEGYKD